jgi:hypothetical protein
LATDYQIGIRTNYVGSTAVVLGFFVVALVVAAVVGETLEDVWGVAQWGAANVGWQRLVTFGCEYCYSTSIRIT